VCNINFCQMKFYFLIFLCYCCSVVTSPVFCQFKYATSQRDSFAGYGITVSTPSSISIIGTVHYGNKVFNHKEIYNELKRQKPDIILIENFRIPKKVWGKPFLRLFGHKFTDETIAYQKYMKKFPMVTILPFDTSINGATYLGERNWVTKNVMGKQISELYKNGAMDSADRFMVERVANLFGNSNPFTEFALDTLNMPWMQDKIRAYHDYLENILPKLVAKYLKDTATAERLKNFNTGWILRNDYMVNSVKRITSNYRGKRIIILVGLGHKYYLIDKLSSFQPELLRLLEFPSSTNEGYGNKL